MTKFQHNNRNDLTTRNQLELHPQLKEKAIFDYFNGLEVLEDHVRFRNKNNNNLLTRILDSLNGIAVKRQNIIDDNITASLDTVSIWLQDIQRYQAKSDIAVNCLANKLIETRQGVMRLQERHKELREQVQAMYQDINRRLTQVNHDVSSMKSDIQYFNANDHLIRVFKKWEREQLKLYPPLARLYIVIDELYWGDFGIYCRSKFGEKKVNELMQDLADKALSQMAKDLKDLGEKDLKGLGNYMSQLMFPQKFLNPINDLPEELREVIGYLSDWAEPQIAPVSWAIKKAALRESELPDDFPRVFSGEYAVHYLLYENKRRIQDNRNEVQNAA
jgi:hypothetical protein